MTPTEAQEQRVVADWLDIVVGPDKWCHVPNGGGRSKIEAKIFKGQGVKRGVPDILIFKRPPKYPNTAGAAVEMKRIKGSRTSPEQRRWLESLHDEGWATGVCKGADEAIAFLKKLGYGRG